MQPGPVSLRTLFSDFPLRHFSVGIPDIPINGIVIDSRKVGPGDLFIARRGGSLDGHTFIPMAIERGAAVIVGEQEPGELPVPYVRVENSIEAVTWLAAAFHDWPGRKLTVIGVTGTDGKTTTCNLLYQVLVAAGIKTGLISTVNAVIGDEILDTGFHVTTPDAPDIQGYLARMAAAGLTHVILETTSHGLAQHRVDACQYDLAVLTNLTHEHLDQHGSFENYRAAKARLFQLLEKTAGKPQGNPRLAVLNQDDGSFSHLSSLVRQLTGVRSVGYGLGSDATIHARKIEYSPGGLHFEAVGPSFTIPVVCPLVGMFNIYNCLAAFSAAVIGLGIDPLIAARGISAMLGVPGRMERIDLGQPFTAIVDFAHTPNALRSALDAARKMTGSRLIVVFGSAGLRDREKRVLMARTAVELADLSILTAEDPRTESLQDILAEMAAGARWQGGVEGSTFYRVPDRGEALRLAVRLAGPGDLVLACGKGHEQSMCFGQTEYPWDDCTALRAALAERLGVPGPRMPVLPTGGSKG